MNDCPQALFLSSRLSHSHVCACVKRVGFLIFLSILLFDVAGLMIFFFFFFLLMSFPLFWGLYSAAAAHHSCPHGLRCFLMLEMSFCLFSLVSSCTPVLSLFTRQHPRTRVDLRADASMHARKGSLPSPPLLARSASA